MDEKFDEYLSLEVITGWPVTRISIAIFIPIVLSLIIGLWYQSRKPHAMAMVQTARAIASYIVTAEGRK
jgi:hypothetical protein